MQNQDINGIVRFIAAYEKCDDGEVVHKYYLKNVILKDLRQIFEVNENESDPGARDLIDCYPITNIQLQSLKKYLNVDIINADDYDLYLECCQDSISDWNILSKKYGYYPPPSSLQGFTEAISIKPKAI